MYNTPFRPAKLEFLIWLNKFFYLQLLSRNAINLQFYLFTIKNYQLIVATTLRQFYASFAVADTASDAQFPIYPNVCLFPNHPITALYRFVSEAFAVIEASGHVQSQKAGYDGDGLPIKT